MLLVPEGERTVAIGQPAHARVSGQLAAAWGNARFGSLEPREEVLLAASQHDTGMAAWDAAPDRNPATGLPFGFTEMALETHLALWTQAPRLALGQSRYVALLVSMHGTALYEMRDLDALTDADAARVRAYIASQRTFQEGLRESLGARPEEIARNQRLLWTWDHLSLAVLLGWAPTTARGVPAAPGANAVDLELTPGAEPGSFTLHPWPFATPSVHLTCDARVLDGPYPDEPALHAALGAAPWVRVDLTLLQSTAP